MIWRGKFAPAAMGSGFVGSFQQGRETGSRHKLSNNWARTNGVRNACGSSHSSGKSRGRNNKLSSGVKLLGLKLSIHFRLKTCPTVCSCSMLDRGIIQWEEIMLVAWCLCHQAISHCLLFWCKHGRNDYAALCFFLSTQARRVSCSQVLEGTIWFIEEASSLFFSP